MKTIEVGTLSNRYSLADFLNEKHISPGIDGDFEQYEDEKTVPVKVLGYECAIEPHPACRMQNAWQIFAEKDKDHDDCLALYDLDDKWH